MIVYVKYEDCSSTLVKLVRARLFDEEGELIAQLFDHSIINLIRLVKHSWQNYDIRPLLPGEKV